MSPVCPSRRKVRVQERMTSNRERGQSSTIHKLSSLQLDSAESLAHKFQIHTVEGTHLSSSSLPFPALRLAPDSERYAAYRTLKRRRAVAIGSKPDLASEVASCCRWALRYRANALKYLYG